MGKLHLAKNKYQKSRTLKYTIIKISTKITSSFIYNSNKENITVIGENWPKKIVLRIPQIFGFNTHIILCVKSFIPNESLNLLALNIDIYNLCFPLVLPQTNKLFFSGNFCNEPLFCSGSTNSWCARSKPGLFVVSSQIEILIINNSMREKDIPAKKQHSPSSIVNNTHLDFNTVSSAILKMSKHVINISSYKKTRGKHRL